MCDPINPYTTSGTFGIPYNGGYKPDASLKWIPPDTNVIDDRDDFVPPPILPPPNMLMQTCEGKRIDPRVGGVPARIMEYDNGVQEVDKPVIIKEVQTQKKGDENIWKFLIFAIILLFVILMVTKFR